MRSNLMGVLRIATPPVLLLLSAYCFAWAFTVGPFGDDLCGDEGVAVRVVGGIIGVLLVAEAVFAVGRLLSKDPPKSIAKHTHWGTALGLILIAGWAFWAIVVSVSCTT